MNRYPVPGGQHTRASARGRRTGRSGAFLIDPLSVGRVQSWGQTLNLAAAIFLPEGTKGKSALTEDIHSFGPGVSRRGYASGGGGEP